MEETAEVIVPEIVSETEENSTSIGSIAVAGLALVGVASAAKFVASKVPFRLRIERTSKDMETPIPTIETPVVAE